MRKQKIKRVALIFLIVFLIIGFYLQYGRDMDVYNSYVFSVGSHNEQNLKIVANKLWIKDKRKYAEEILEKCKANSFKSIDFCYDSYIPIELYVDVYLSDAEVRGGCPVFSFSYLPEDMDMEYNFIEDSAKYILKIQ